MASARAIFDRLREGEEAEEFTVGPITRTHIVRYAGASGDFNPLHHDDEYARSLGNPQIFAMGMFPAGILASAATRWLGLGHIRRLSVRFRSRVWPDDRLAFRGRVERKTVKGEEGSILCSLRVVNQSGEEVITGEVVAVFPLTGRPSESAGNSVTRNRVKGGK
jgi:acyl dehydratase